ALGWHWARDGDGRCVWIFRVYRLNLDLLLGVVREDLAPERQRVGDLAVVLASFTDAGVLTVELDAGVRALDAVQLGLHALRLVGVQVAQPDRCALTVRTVLGLRQPATPQRLHVLLMRVLHVVGKLGAAVTGLGALDEGLEMHHRVGDQLHTRGAVFDGPRPRQIKRP
ncbi:MAG: hypothetical protein ACK559_14205, partial [bacterium]